MTIKEFCEAYKAKKFMNTKQGIEERIDWIKKELIVKPYISFKDKRSIAEMIISQNIKEADGVKKYDSVNAYISLVVASIAAHTNLEWGADPVADYDLLAESGLLSQVLSEIKGSYDEIGMILQMALAMELEDNNINVLVGRFLNKISGMLDGVIDMARDKFGDFDLQSVLGADFKEEDLAKLKGFLDKYNK